MESHSNQLKKKLGLLGVLAVLVSCAAGCTAGSGFSLRPQSHFDYPNSNVVPLGRVQAEVSKTSLFFPQVLDADLQEEVIHKALKQKGGDILLDYVLKTEITMVPLVFLNFFTTTYKVDGTAARMKIGKREGLR